MASNNSAMWSGLLVWFGVIVDLISVVISVMKGIRTLLLVKGAFSRAFR